MMSQDPTHNTEVHVPDIYFRTSTGRAATDMVMSHILDQLLAGELRPGQRVNTKQICEKLGVSVVPAREAIHFFLILR